MSVEVQTCPRCEATVPAGERACPTCGQPLDGANTWPARAMPEPPAAVILPARDPLADLEPVPLVFAPDPAMSLLTRVAHLVFLLALIGSTATWIVAERQIVARDPWRWWDATWIAAALITVALALVALTWLRRQVRVHGWRDGLRRIAG